MTSTRETFPCEGPTATFSSDSLPFLRPQPVAQSPTLLLSYHSVFPKAPTLPLTSQHLPPALTLPLNNIPGVCLAFPALPPPPFWPPLATRIYPGQAPHAPSPSRPPFLTEAGVQTTPETGEACVCQRINKCGATDHFEQSFHSEDQPGSPVSPSPIPSGEPTVPVPAAVPLAPVLYPQEPSESSPPSSKFRLTHLCTAIQTLFIHGQIPRSEYDPLSPFEKRLFYYLVKRKFAPKSLSGLEPDDATCDFDRLKQIVAVQAPRRPEECYKFVLTRVLKHIRRQIEAQNASQNSEAYVNEVYFGTVSAQFGIPLADFRYPLAGNQKGKVHFNFRYFSKIFKSEAFLQKLNEYTREAIFADYQKDLAKKVAALTQKWERMLSNDPAFLEYSQVAILRYVIFNKRCKLPWTQVDVVNAIDRIKDLIHICSEGKSNVGGHLIRNAFRLRHENTSK